MRKEYRQRTKEKHFATGCFAVDKGRKELGGKWVKGREMVAVITTGA